MAATLSRRLLALSLLLLTALPAAAHATLVLGSLTFEPDPPQAGSETVIRLEMVDPTQFPIEDAVVLIEMTPDAGGDAVSASFSETAPGLYRASLTLEAPGEYQVLMRDQTFRQEEARVTLPVTIGEAPLEAVRFVFPPTATGSNRSITTWLIWLIGVPVVAGIVVTVLVLTGGRGQAGDEGSES